MLIAEWIVLVLAAVGVISFAVGVRNSETVMPGTALTMGLWTIACVALLYWDVSLLNLLWIFPVIAISSPVLMAVPGLGMIFRAIAVVAYKIARIGNSREPA